MTMRAKDVSRIVNVKEKAVDAASERLSVQNRQLGHEEGIMAELLQGFEQVAASAVGARRDTFTAADLAAWQQYTNRSRRQYEQQRIVVKQNELERDANLADVVSAYQDAARWSLLHVKKQTLETEEETRSEQRVMDDTATIRHVRIGRARAQE